MNLEHYISQNNWPTDLEQAREFAREAVNNWQWKEKAPRFLGLIDSAKSITRLQQIVVNTYLSGEGLGVVKF